LLLLSEYEQKTVGAIYAAYWFYSFYGSKSRYPAR